MSELPRLLHFNSKNKFDAFVSLFQQFNAWTDVICCQFYHSYMHMQLMNDSRVALADLVLHKEWFGGAGHYNVPKLTATSSSSKATTTTAVVLCLYLPIKLWVKVLQYVSKQLTDVTTVVLDNGGSTSSAVAMEINVVHNAMHDCLYVDFMQRTTTGVNRREYTVPLIAGNEAPEIMMHLPHTFDDSSSENVNTYTPGNMCEFRMLASYWCGLLSECASFQTDVCIQCVNPYSRLCFTSRNSDDTAGADASTQGRIKIELDTNDRRVFIDDSFEITVMEIENDGVEDASDSNICASYTLSVLYKLCSTPKISTCVSVFVHNKNPIRILYALGHQSNLNVYCAPKIDMDETPNEN